MCSTGAFCRFPDLTDHRRILRYGEALGIPLEVLIYPDWPLGGVAKDLVRSALDVRAVHADKDVPARLAVHDESAFALLETNARFTAALGAQLLVLHAWRADGAGIKSCLDALPRCAAIATAAGITLGIETVPCGPRPILDTLQEALACAGTCGVVLDTEFLARGGEFEEALSSAWLWEAGRVVHVHAKDWAGSLDLLDGPRYLQPGAGRVDFGALAKAFAGYGFRGGLSLEASALDPWGRVDLVALRRSIEYLAML